ncbi:WD40-repeat-containing domain protein [Sphaerosporella brunnea]|uniref:WD40-repeat-containing domain protein n=1 Tax=Sphaerosporella brunnea TaxID=1250544 RepID=A0A5J5EFH3_9PEZI|nr:WD40-repeat-containing domain protein [Sphaerosporella brunnea]
MSTKNLSAPTNPNSYVHFSTGHEDLVHDVAYDYYGRRMATVSSDQRLKIFDLNDEGEWVIADSFKAHDSSINKVIWGPPEHGQIVATCSYDRTVRIWEEQEMGSPHRWKRQFQMTSDARTAIHSIGFPPTLASTASTSTGLKLAFISADGHVHIYECREPQDLTHWIAIDVVAVLPAPPPREVEVSFCLAFCPSRWGGEQLVVGAMDTARVYRHNASGKFRPAEELPGHRGLVRDVAWAVSMGRSYHLIATACKDGHVRIFKLTAASGRGDRWIVEKVADFADHKSEVWKVAWNATGTILSSTGDDGKIRLWKAAIHGEFQLLSVVATPRSRGRDEAIIEDD